MRADDFALELSDELARISIHPHAGGSIGQYDTADGVPILVKGGAGRSGVFALGCQLLLPFANRISGGGFAYGQRFCVLSPNIEGERYPIHGNAAQSSWEVRSSAANEIVLELRSAGPGNFRYSAELIYTLIRGSLTAKVTVTNMASSSMPFGVGFHPWFARTPQTTISFQSEGYWTETPAHLPMRFVVPVGEGDYAAPRALPEGWINTAFTGWPGVAEIVWPEHGAGVRISSPDLKVLMVYSPGQDADFVCLEPVSHTVDAHNRRGYGVVAPMDLRPGESLSAQMTIAPFGLT